MLNEEFIVVQDDGFMNPTVIYVAEKSPAGDNISENSPSFINIQTAAIELRSAYWGSHGWAIGLPEHSDYMFAIFGSYLLRYNIAGNTIDKVVKRTCPPGFEPSWRLSTDGRYALSYQSPFPDGTGSGPVALLKFDGGGVTHVSDTTDMFSTELLPQHIRDAFNFSTWGWDGVKPRALDNYTLVYEYVEGVGNCLYAYDGSGQKREIPELRNSLLSSELPYVVVDGKTICTLIPMDYNSRAYLGYYKFALIDLESGKVIRECPINTGPVDLSLMPWLDEEASPLPANASDNPPIAYESINLSFLSMGVFAWRTPLTDLSADYSNLTHIIV
jgi:hypothetical protein